MAFRFSFLLVLTQISILVSCAAPPKERPVEALVDAPPVQETEGKIQSLTGEVQVKTQTGELKPVSVGEPVPMNSAIVTGKDGRIRLAMKDGNELELAPESQMVVEAYENNSAKKNVLMNLIRGKIRAQVREKYKGPSDRFQIKTPASVAGVRGTDFATIYDESKAAASTVTFEGAVDFGTLAADGSIKDAVTVTKGQESRMVQGLPPTKPRVLSNEELEGIKESISPDTAHAVSETKTAPTESAAKESTPKEIAGAQSVRNENADAQIVRQWLRNGNVRFTKGYGRADRKNKKLTKEQPHAIVVTSSDSRLSPEIIFDQKLGEISVVRSQTLDAGAIASVEHAVTHFNIRYLLVLGFTTKVDGWDPKAQLEVLKRSPILAKAIAENRLLAESALYDLNTGVAQF